ncbi:hypothetical protein [uncultured Arcticibacterium sp.]|uniref:hypothetical protein n=1 Tax=uncultured Arcticibacterium sp. TaxID=2173042 RepID=UPI0030F9EC8A
MPEITEHLNIPLDRDIKVFISPTLIEGERGKSQVSNKLYLRTKAFFSHLVNDFVIPDDEVKGVELLNFLHEPYEYRIGYSNGTYFGKGVGPEKGKSVFNAFKNNSFAQRGVSILSDPLSILLLVDGIGQDNVSDILANVCRDLFCEFTLKQCLKYNVPTSDYTIDYFNLENLSWETKVVQLPSYRGKEIILLPYWAVSKELKFNLLYNKHVCLKYIWEDIVRTQKVSSIPDRFLIVNKRGEIRPNIGAMMEEYKLSKKEFRLFVLKYQNSISTFRDDVNLKYPALSYQDLKGIYKEAS